MKLLADKWRVRWNDDTAFYGYRWFGWALAGLALTLPGRAPANLPGEAGLLLLLGAITVAATAMAQSYVRLARQRPIVMTLDLLIGVLVVWLSGGSALPFMPYALGALVLPALLGGWRGALIAGGGFAALDSGALVLRALGRGGAISPSELVLRALVPLLFGAAWLLMRRLLADNTRSGAAVDAPPMGASSRRPSPSDADERFVRLSALADRGQEARVSPERANHPRGAPTQLQSFSRSDAARHAIFDLAPGESLSFLAALEQLRVSFARQEGVAVQLTTQGTACPLSGAQHSVLLRVAQEALMNVYQHAHAHTVLMMVTYEPQAVTLSVQDDGVGLLDGTFERPGMHALRAVRYRLAELDGHLAVFEGEGGGVTLRATLPLG